MYFCFTVVFPVFLLLLNIPQKWGNIPTFRTTSKDGFLIVTTKSKENVHSIFRAGTTLLKLRGELQVTKEIVKYNNDNNKKG